MQNKFSPLTDLSDRTKMVNDFLNNLNNCSKLKSCVYLKKTRNVLSLFPIKITNSLEREIFEFQQNFSHQLQI